LERKQSVTQVIISLSS